MTGWAVERKNMSKYVQERVSEMGLDDELIDRENGSDAEIEKAHYDTTVDSLETDGIKPIRKAPSISSINGMGLTLYGRNNYHKESSSYITTRYLVFSFIPLLPLSRYRVKETGGSIDFVSSVTKYEFMWELPLTNTQKVHKYIFFVALAALVLTFVLKS